MITIKSHEVYADVADFDTVTKRLVWRRRGPGERIRISGIFGRLGTESAVLYKRDGRLRLYVNRDDLDLSDVQSRFSSEGHRRRLQLSGRQGLLLDVDYNAPDINPPVNGVLTPGEDEENYDFALLLHNILVSPERRQTCLAVWE